MVVELPPLEAFPDAQFVEDTALCLPGIAIMMHPGAETRRGEVQPMREALSLIFDEIVDITEGFIEAGDILVTEREVLVGKSARTDDDGIARLNQSLMPWICVACCADAARCSAFQNRLRHCW